MIISKEYCIKIKLNKMSNSKLPFVLNLAGFFGLIICFCSFYSCSKKRISKTEFSDLDKAIPATTEIYDIINLALKDYPFVGSIRLMEVLPNDSSGYEFLFEPDSINRMNHVKNVHEYLSEFKSNFGKSVPYKIEKNRIRNIELVEESIYLSDIPFEEKFKTIEPYLVIYTPLISRDGRIVLVSVDEICFGLCGSGYTLIFSKGTKNWEKGGVIYRWVS